MESASEKKQDQESKKADGKSTLEEIKSRESKEIVLGFCGPAGSGISTVKEKLAKVLKESYGYEIESIKLSDFIKDNVLSANSKVKTSPGDLEAEDVRAITYQNAGNELRNDHGKEILASLAIRKIGAIRDGRGKRLKGERRAYLVDSLKNPYELLLFRAVYGDIFHLFGVLCPEPERTRRLQKKGMREDQAKKIIEQDRDQDIAHGQKMLHTLKDSDFFVRNTDPEMDKLESRIRRFVELILGNKTITPDENEFAMYVAESSAARSGCLSRQVGASIMDQAGVIVSTGTNDVPKYRGGLYPDCTRNSDQRCFKLYGEYCRNDRYKEEIFKKIFEILNRKIEDIEKCNDVLEEIRQKTKIGGLIEFSRSVHAEMDAIISLARNGKYGTQGCCLFTTTFPCHNCARHIVAAGIEKVFYIEPYEKSMAYELHDDSIDLEDVGGDGNNKVQFLHYEGVAPSRYLKYFRFEGERKKGGRLIEFSPRRSKPPVTENLFSYQDLEDKVAEELRKKGL